MAIGDPQYCLGNYFNGCAKFKHISKAPPHTLVTSNRFVSTWLTGFFFDFRTHWCAVYPSKKPQSTARDYGKTCEASGEDWCTKSNSNKTHTKYPQNYGTSSNRYMCTDSKSLFFKDNPQNLSNLQSIITILFLLYIFFLWKDKTILYVFINNVPMYNKFSFLLEY